MGEHEHNSKTGRKQDTCLLVAALVVGLAGTLNRFGTDRITWPAVACLAGAMLLAARPVAGLFRRGKILSAQRGRVVALLVGIHLIATCFFFPPEDLGNGRPVITLDHALHYYQVERARRVFWRSLRLNAYDPFFMAGYPGGTVFDLDSKGVELWSSLLGFIDTARTFKMFIFLAHFLIVTSLYFGCRRLQFSFRESVLACLVFLCFWHWGRPYAGHFRFAGMFAYVFVSHLSLYLVGLFRDLLDEKPVKRFYLLGPLAFFIHPTAGVLLPVPFVAMFLVERFGRRLTGRRPGWTMRLVPKLLLWLVLVILVNAVWLVPFLRYLDIKTSSETFFQIGGVQELAGLVLKPGNLPALLLLLLAATGLVSLWRQRRLTAAVATASAGLFLMFLAGFGVYLPVFDQMEPGRFLLPVFVFLAPPAGTGCSILIGRVSGLAHSRPAVRALRLMAVMLLIAFPAAASLVSARAYYRHTLSTTFPPAVQDLIAAVQDHTNSSGRLMIEDGPAWTYGNCHLPSVLPLFTSVEQIGGPYPYTFIKHHFSSFQLDCTFGWPLSEVDPARLEAFLKLYKVKWILTATEEGRSYIERLSSVQPLWSSKQYVLWRYPDGLDSNLWEGITVRADYDLIEVAIELRPGRPPADNILLSYHWDKGLRVSPPARIHQVRQLDDPVPLILLEPNQAREIKITYH
jgi:hypothetical protein